MLDASGNWWGIEHNRGRGRRRGHRSGFQPVARRPGPISTPETGFMGSLAFLHVDDNSPQVGAIGRIQEGVDLVNDGSSLVTRPCWHLCRKRDCQQEY